MTLKELRQTIAAFVQTTIDVETCHAYPPGALTADQAYIVAGTPYLAPKDNETFCRVGWWSFDIYIATSAQDIEAAAQWLDVQMQTLITALHAGELADEIGQPAFVDYGRGGDVGRTVDKSLFVAVIPLQPLEA